MQNLDKIEKIFNMIGSDSDGEIVNAVALIKRNLKAQGKNWNDFSKHLFGATPRTGETFRDRQEQRWGDMAAEMRRQREADNARRQREQDSQTYGSGRYKAQDPYPGYAEHKKMSMAIVALIMSGKNPMTEWETAFAKDIYNKNICHAKSLSSKQESILQRIYEQYIKT